MKILKFMLPVLLLTLQIQAQSKVEITIQLVTPNLVGDVILKTDETLEWLKEVKTIFEQAAAKEKGNKDIALLINLYQHKNADFAISAKPNIGESFKNDLIRKLKGMPSPNTKMLEFSLVIFAKVNKGASEKEAFVPKLLLPYDIKFNEFKKADLAAKKKALQDWVLNEIIPIVAHYESNVESHFEGVLAIGKLLSDKNWMKTAIENSTIKNPKYWRGLMEMSQGNLLPTFSAVCMYIVNGEFDKAKRLIFIVRLFSQDDTLPMTYFDFLQAEMSLMSDELEKEINKGIQLHDAKKYDEAIAVYEKLLKIFPNSAWLQYELYYSKSSKKGLDDIPETWSSAKDQIFACDPLYHMNVHANNGKEAYLLFRRQSIQLLFQNKENLKKDILEYADIALDLEVYGFAAELYWQIYTNFEKKDYGNRNILAHYLYCLKKLGNDEAATLFKDDFNDEYIKIEKERKELMTKSSIYQSFQQKE